MTEQAKVPAIRFAGFTDPWEQRKLSEVATFGGGHTPPMADPDNYEDGYVLWVTSQDVKSNYLDRTTTQITEKGAKELTLYPAGSLVMVTRSGILRHTLPVAELRKPSTVNQDIRVILPQGECCGEWLLQFFISHNKELLLEFGKTGTTVESVDFGKIKDMLLYMPSTVEQQQIGDFFAKLDSLITLHQRKYDKLVILKKSMLEKMFPKDGADVPEVRFKGFTGPWERRKFGDVFEEYSEKNRADLPPLTIIQGSGTIRRDESERALQYDKASLSNYKVVNEGDLIVHLRSFEGGLEKANSQGIISPAYHTFHGEGVDSRFYYTYFRSKNFIDTDLKPHVYGIRDGRSIDIEGMKTIEIPFTSYPEQKLIGDAIDSINTLISLQRRELEKLQSIKKALLEKMFV